MDEPKAKKQKLHGKNNSKLITVLFIILFALIGTIIILVTRAASNSVAIEAEAGTVTSPASTVNNASASGGKYVKYGVAQCPAGTTGTPPNCVPTGGGSAILVGAGDIAECSGGNDEKTGAVVQNVLNANPSAVVFTAGDNAYPDGSGGATGNYTKCYDPSWGGFKAKTKPIPGNHEWHTANLGGYLGYFGSSFGPSTAPWYSYNLGGWHVVMLDSNCGNINCSTETTWLKNDLANNTAQCTVAMWHHPVFNIGNHDTAGDTGKGKPFWTELYADKADLIINGHDHNYQRWTTMKPDGTVDATNGIREIVVGTGGAGSYAFTRTDSKVEAKSATAFGVLKLTLKSGSYDWQFMPASGTSFTDSGSDSCH